MFKGIVIPSVISKRISVWLHSRRGRHCEGGEHLMHAGKVVVRGVQHRGHVTVGQYCGGLHPDQVVVMVAIPRVRALHLEVSPLVGLGCLQ